MNRTYTATVTIEGKEEYTAKTEADSPYEAGNKIADSTVRRFPGKAFVIGRPVAQDRKGSEAVQFLKQIFKF